MTQYTCTCIFMQQGAKASAKAASKDWDVDEDGVSAVSLADADAKVL